MNRQCRTESTGNADAWMREMARQKIFADRPVDGLYRVVDERVQVRARIGQPGINYSKRSRHIAELRSQSAALRALEADGCEAPTPAAMSAAMALIGDLFEGCLDFRLELSHDGEINLLFGDAQEMFHINIDASGSINYYSSSRAGELSNEVNSPRDFPHRELHQFVDRNK